MKALSFLALLAACAACLAQSHMTISVGGHFAGYATVSHRLQPDGTKVDELRLELVSRDGKARLSVESRYDPKGNPTRKFQELKPATGASRQIIASFDAAGASVVLMDGERRTAKAVSLASEAPRALSSEFWFVRDQPKAGDVARAYQFNLDTLEWELATITYRGPKEVSVGGRKVTAHLVETERGGRVTSAYLDDQGLPLLIEQDRTRMERIWQK